MIGPVGRTVIANVERLRRAHRLSLRGLSAKMAEEGRPIGDTVLQRQSQGRRRIDADDLAAFARVFGVPPAQLLARPEAAEAADHPVSQAARTLATLTEALVSASGDPHAVEQMAGQIDRAIRRVQLETEELIATATVRTHDRTNPAATGTHDHGNPAARETP